MSGQRREAIPLDVRITAAFSDGAKSDDAAELMEEAERAAQCSAEAAGAARLRALDPSLSPCDVAAARREMEDASFRQDRFQEAVRRLGERIRELRSQEREAERLIAYETALAERDVLAEELSRTYPAVAEQLADLVARIDENDKVIGRINLRGLPQGVRSISSVEEVARGLRGFRDGTTDIPRITERLRLPAFEYCRHAPYGWPRPRRGIG